MYRIIHRIFVMVPVFFIISGVDPENLKGGSPGKRFDNLPGKPANVTLFFEEIVPKLGKKFPKFFPQKLAAKGGEGS